MYIILYSYQFAEVQLLFLEDNCFCKYAQNFNIMILYKFERVNI